MEYAVKYAGEWIEKRKLNGKSKFVSSNKLGLHNPMYLLAELELTKKRPHW